MAKDTVPIRATTTPSHSLNPLKSPTKSEAPLPPTPAKHKRLSFPKLHHHDGLTNEPSNSSANAKSKTENDSEKIDVVKDRRTSSASTAVPTTRIPKRPTMGQINRQNSVQTRYMTMLLHLDEIPRLHNILASFFTWILLAGFVIFPGTFTSLQAGKFDDKAKTESAKSILSTVKHVPLLVVAATACVLGTAGMIWLWYRWRRNYVWLVNRIFLPGSLNSFAGLISTLVNVYTQQDGAWSLTAKVTAIVTGACMAITAGLLLLYNMWYLERVRKDHSRNWVGNLPEEQEDGGSKVPMGVLGKI